MTHFKFAFGWRQRAQEPMVAALRRAYPYKSVYDFRAESILCDFERAHFDYQWGAAAALLDLIVFAQDHELPLPTEMLSDFEEYARMALSGLNVADGTNVPHPMARHRGALIKRLRYAHVADVLAEEGSSTNRIEAASIAKELMPAVAGAKYVESETLYRDFVEVEKAIVQAKEVTPAAMRVAQTPQIWPGIFYLPTRATCDALGWLDISDAFWELSITDDAPRLIMV